MEEDAVDGPVVCESRDKVLQALSDMTTGKSNEPSKLSLKLIAASGEVGIPVMAEICQRVVN